MTTLYNNITRNKFIPSQNVRIMNNDKSVQITCCKISDNIGVKIGNITFPVGKYTIIINIKTEIQTHLFLKNNKTKELIKYKLCDGINEIDIDLTKYESKQIDSYDLCVYCTNINIGDKFTIYDVTIVDQKMELNKLTKLELTFKNIISYVVKHTYLIKLDNISEHERTIRYLEKLNINCDVIDHNTINIDTSMNEINIINLHEYQKILSHHKIISDAIKNDYQSVLVFEDGAIPMKNIPDHELNIPDDWEILYLGCQQNKFDSGQLRMGDDFYIAKNSGKSFAYIIKSCIYEKYSELLLKALHENSFINIDEILISIQDDHKCYVIYENLFMMNEIENPENFGWDRNKYYPEISIIFPIVNEDTILECLNSVKEQKYTDYELIFVQDKENDIVKEFIKNNKNLDISLNIFSGKFNNISELVSTGINKSKGKYITFLHCESKLNDKYLLLLRDYLHLNKTLSVVSEHTIVGGFMFDNNACKEILRKYTFMSCNIFQYGDDMLEKILELKPFKTGYIKQKLIETTNYNYVHVKNEISEKYSIMNDADKYISEEKDTIIYAPLRNYNTINNIKYDRPYQIMKKLSKYCNSIFLITDENIFIVNDNILFLSWRKFLELQIKIKTNKLILFFNDVISYKLIDKIKPTHTMCDYKSRAMYDYKSEKIVINLSEIDVIIYASQKVGVELENNGMVYKNEPVYVGNGYDNIINNINNIVSQNEQKIVGYYNYSEQELDLNYDIINQISENQKFSVVLIGKFDETKLEKNIKIIKMCDVEMYKYVNNFDICLLPYKNKENFETPRQLFEFMCYEKPIISTIKFEDGNEYFMVNKQNVINVLERIDINQKYLYKNSNFDENCRELFYKIVTYTRNCVVTKNKCAYVYQKDSKYKKIINEILGGNLDQYKNVSDVKTSYDYIIIENYQNNISQSDHISRKVILLNPKSNDMNGLACMVIYTNLTDYNKNRKYLPEENIKFLDCVNTQEAIRSIQPYKKNILILHDSDVNLDIFVQCLNQKGYDVKICTTVDENSIEYLPNRSIIINMSNNWTDELLCSLSNGSVILNMCDQLSFVVDGINGFDVSYNKDPKFVIKKIEEIDEKFEKYSNMSVEISKGFSVKRWKEKIENILAEIHLIQHLIQPSQIQFQNEKRYLDKSVIIADENISVNVENKIYTMQKYLNNDVYVLINNTNCRTFKFKFQKIHILDDISKLITNYNYVMHYLSLKNYNNEMIQKVLMNSNKTTITYLTEEGEILEYNNKNNFVVVSNIYLAQKYYQKTRGKCYVLNDFINNFSYRNEIEKNNCKIIGCV